jgi:type II secretory pathway component GspD/PulD (secretin)
MTAGAVLGQVARAEQPVQVAQLFSRPASAQTILSRAIESQRRGDYESAAPLFQEAVRRQDELTPTERDELARLSRDNTEALKSRRQGAELLHKAEKASTAGHSAECATLLKQVATVQQYLTADDKLLFQKLNRPGNIRQVSAVEKVDSAETPRAGRLTLKLGREMFRKLDLDAAEALARDAEKEGKDTLWAPGEDSPRKLLADVARARADSGTLLKAARAALQRKEYDRAEYFAHEAEKVTSRWSMNMWGDTPAKVLKDIQAARKAVGNVTTTTPPPLKPTDKIDIKQGNSSAYNAPSAKTDIKLTAATDVSTNVKLADHTAPGNTAPGDSSKPVTPAPSNDTEGARALLLQGRKALKDGDLGAARRFCDQARAKKPALGYWEDNPEKLQADIARAEAKTKPAPVTPVARPVQPAEKEKPKPLAGRDEAMALLRQGRAQLAENKLEEAGQSAMRAKNVLNVHWGLFEDNPDKLQQDVLKARTRHDQEESVKELAKARQLLGQGDLDNAAKAAFLAQKLHGPYTVWDLSDRPSKVLAEIDTARARQKKMAGASTTVVKETPATAGGAARDTHPATPTGKPAEPKVTVEQLAREQLAEAQLAVTRNDLGRARAIVAQVRVMPIKFDRPGELSPDDIDRQIDLKLKAQASVTPPVDTAPAPSIKPPPPSIVTTSVPPTPVVPPIPTPSPVVVPTAPTTMVERATPMPTPVVVPPAPMPAPVVVPPVPTQTPVVVPPLSSTNVSVNVTTPMPTPVAPVAPMPTPVAPIAPVSMTVQADSVPSPVPTPMTAAPPQVDPRKERAVKLMAEARSLVKNNHIPEARAKLIEAQQLGVAFGPDEDSPEQLNLQLSSLVRQRVDQLTRRADDYVRRGKDEPMKRFEIAEADLQKTRQLAVAFGQDVLPIDSEIEFIHQQRNACRSIAAMTPAAPDVPAPGVAQVTKGASTSAPPLPHTLADDGRDILQKARLEIRAGQLTQARRMAEMVCQGNYGIREEAIAILRTIDAEEGNQRRLAINREFDAAERAFNRGDYAYAGSILGVIDPRALDPARYERLRNIMSTPAMQPSNRQIVQASGQSNVPPPPSGSVPPQPMPPETGHAVASDIPAPGQGILETTAAMRNIAFQKWRADGLTVQREATEKFRAGQTDQALDMLNGYLEDLRKSQLDPAQTALLRRPVESRLTSLRLLADQKLVRDENDKEHNKATTFAVKKQQAESIKQQHIKELMQQYTDLMKQAKYEEASVAAMKVKEIDPDNATATAACMIADMQRKHKEYDDIKKGREDYFLAAANDADKTADSRIFKDPLIYDQHRWLTAKDRKDLATLPQFRKNEKERDIEHKLMAPVSLNFTNAPLRQVLDDIRSWHGININVDEPALLTEGIELSHSINIKLEQVSLKSALNMLLHNVHLTYVIKDEALQITTEAEARGKKEMKVYNVADLVLPVQDFGRFQDPSAIGMSTPMSQQPQGGLGAVPGPGRLGGAQAVGTPTGTPYTPGGTEFGAGTPGGVGGNGQVQARIRNASETQEAKLISLITNTIQPNSWYENSGPGTIEYLPLTMSLVINQSPDIQGEIQDLLNALRRLQEQEVAVEVRFITIAEDYYERIGVNFSMNITTNNQKFAPELTQAAFNIPPQLNNFQPNRFLSGLTSAGALTSDLNIPITNNTFSQTVPTFGGYNSGYGGISLGLAFLSEIQVFLFLEAVAGDNRTNVMQAPKLTLYNGQVAQLQAQDYVPFVGGVNVVTLENGDPVLQAFNAILTPGTQLTLQAVISADRRYVRLALQPTLTNIVPGTLTNLFPVVVPIFPTVSPLNQNNPPIILTQMMQQPVTTVLSVGTTVSVPDGGTVLMGGLKRLSEARSEYGPPIISKIPILNRLFKNVAYGRDTESLMIMVTPRIIIQAEEEITQTGFINPNG